ncbi:MAG: hypothetical protein RBS73_12965 [Prolixibacteraceae bacterium]|jgi:hypothetical protein|nr:hypothetical protein [Prolixibacteraceae bacterium]
MRKNSPLSFKLFRIIPRTVQLIIPVLIFVFVACSDRWEISNPYRQVKWENDGQYKANLHTHTTRSDGSHAPQYVVDKYHQLGYNILALTDHNEVTFPWTSFASMEASTKSKERLKEGKVSAENLVYENRDPKVLGMIAIQGNEVSSPHHVGSLFNDYNRPTKQEDSTFIATAAKNGLVIINHPGRYKHNAQWYIDFYKKYNHLVGMEIYNQVDRYPNDRQLWDSVLVALLPARPVWAYSNDDMHGEAKLGYSWNIFILPELSEEWVRKGMEEGRSFYVHSPQGHKNLQMPVVQSVQVFPKKGRIDIRVTGQDSVRWISGGKIIQRGASLKLNDCPDISSYVRAEIFGPQGLVVGTQPFSVSKR